MNIRTQIIVAVFVITALVIIINMVCRKVLELRYALTWFVLGSGILVLDLVPGLIEKISDIMGIITPVNMLFFIGFCFLLGIIFVLTIAVSRMSIRIKELAQEVALYKKEIEK